MKDKFLKMAGVKTEEEFYKMFPSEEAFFQAYPEAREMKKGGNVPTNPSLYSRVKSEAKSKFDRWPCVPVETSKALTKEGWKSYDELEVGELILAYDMKTKTNKWTPILNLHYYENVPTIDIIKPGHNLKITSTSDHKWVVYRKDAGNETIIHKDAELVYSLIQKLKNKEITFVEAKEFKSSIQRHYNVYKDHTWEEFLQDSKFSKGGEFLVTTEELKDSSKHFVIKNAAVLDSEYQDSKIKLTSKYGESWTSRVLNMSQNEAEIWFSSSIVYDGNQQKDYEVNPNGSKTYKTYGFKQKHPDHQDAFVASCILTGRRVRYGNYSENGCRNFYITERDYIPLDTAIFEEGETTTVWCPETEFGTWVMNQNGFVTITGNSAYGSAWLVKEYKRRGGGYRKAQNGMQMEQMFAYPQYDTQAMGNMQAFYQDAVDNAKENAFGNATRSFTDAIKVSQAMQPQDKGASGESSGMDPQAIAGIAKLLSGFKDGGKMPQWLAEARFKAAGKQDMMDQYGYAYGGDPSLSYMNPMVPQMAAGGDITIPLIMQKGGEPDGGMALGQLMSIMEKANKLKEFINVESDLEPWVNSKITMADDYIDAVSDYMMYGQEYDPDLEGEEEEEEEDEYTMGEMEEMKNGGIPQRYKNMGFNKVGVKKKSTRPGKKWMVLAKKGDKYKVVHGGYTGMKDFSQHGSEKRKKNFWNRMGGKDSAKATDPFSPLYWHKRLGTWEKGGEPQNAGFQALPDYVQNKIMANMAYGGDMYGGEMDLTNVYEMMKGGMPCYMCGGQKYEKGGIYINPANKGKFTESANRAGMGVQEFAKHVLANKEDYSAKQVRRANFARNSAGWKKQMGGAGVNMGDTLELHDDEIQKLIDMGYTVEYLD